MNLDTPFVKRVIRAVSSIPAGRVATYGDVAVRAGKPGAARAVGNVMARAKVPGLPYHRVIASGGVVGGYGASPQLKRSLLAAEGVELRGKRVRHFATLRWRWRR